MHSPCLQSCPKTAPIHSPHAEQQGSARVSVRSSPADSCRTPAEESAVASFSKLRLTSETVDAQLLVAAVDAFRRSVSFFFLACRCNLQFVQNSVCLQRQWELMLRPSSSLSILATSTLLVKISAFLEQVDGFTDSYRTFVGERSAHKPIRPPGTLGDETNRLFVHNV